MFKIMNFPLGEFYLKKKSENTVKLLTTSLLNYTVNADEPQGHKKQKGNFLLSRIYVT